MAGLTCCHCRGETGRWTGNPGSSRLQVQAFISSFALGGPNETRIDIDSCSVLVRVFAFFTMEEVLTGH